MSSSEGDDSAGFDEAVSARLVSPSLLIGKGELSPHAWSLAAAFCCR